MKTQVDLSFLYTLLSFGSETIPDCPFDEAFFDLPGSYSNAKSCADACLKENIESRYIILSIHRDCYCSTSKPSQFCVYANAQVYKIRGMYHCVDMHAGNKHYF